MSARDVGTGKEQKIRIESSSRPDAAEVEKMRKDAEAHAGEDKRKRELIDARNMADQIIYQPSGDGKGKDDVIDAEFEVKK